MNTKNLLLGVAIFAFLLNMSHAQVSSGWSGDFQPGVTLGSTYQVESSNSSARLNQLSAFLADQLTHNRTIKNIADSKIAVASFVSLQALNETDKVGVALEERLMHEMQTRGFNVVDYRVTGNLKIRNAGDFVYSRNVGDLKQQYSVNYFLAGVIENNADGYVIHARMIDASNNLLVSSAQAFLNGRDAKRILGDFKATEGPVVVVDKPIPAAVSDHRVRLN